MVRAPRGPVSALTPGEEGGGERGSHLRPTGGEGLELQILHFSGDSRFFRSRLPPGTRLLPLGFLSPQLQTSSYYFKAPAAFSPLE